MKQLVVKTVFLIILAFVPYVVLLADDSGNRKNILFKIERSRDADVIHYEVNLLEDGSFNVVDPIRIYWVKHYSAQSGQVNHVNSEQFNKVIQNEKGTLLDVRTESEFLNGHLPDAGQLNFYAFNFNKKLLLLPKDQPVYLYCNTGWRSKKAAETLVKNGYTKVYNLEKGIMEWELQNLPVVVEPNARPETKDKMEWDEFNALVESGKTVFIDFYAPWCAPCRQMMPMIDDLKNEYAGKISVVKINADASKRLVKKLELGTVPYFVLYNQSQQIFSHKGLIERNQLENLFSEYL